MTSSRFGGLKAQLKPGRVQPEPEPKPQPIEAPPIAMPSTRAKAREGKKAVVGYFSEDLSLAIRLLALEKGTTVQGLLGEAIDLLMRDNGKHPFGER